jgi:hypothetical protein
MPFTAEMSHNLDSSFHYHVLGGVALAYAVYSQTYSNTSPYIRGTFRDDPKFLMVSAAVWLVGTTSSNIIMQANLRLGSGPSFLT